MELTSFYIPLLSSISKQILNYVTNLMKKRLCNKVLIFLGTYELLAGKNMCFGNTIKTLSAKF